MGKRHFVHMDLKTGKVSEQRTQTPDGTIEERFEGLMTSHEEHIMGPSTRFLWVVCDGCGERVEVEQPELPEDWITNERGELCPECQ